VIFDFVLRLTTRRRTQWIRWIRGASYELALPPAESDLPKGGTTAVAEDEDKGFEPRLVIPCRKQRLRIMCGMMGCIALSL
jgi:hypothetical protein